MKCFLQYLKQHLLTVAAFLLFTVIFGVVFFLYSLPIEAVGYAALLSAAAGLIIIAADFAFFFLRHKKLERLKKEISVSADNLPDPRFPLENDYREIILLLKEENTVLLSKQETRYNSLCEYYTLWAHQIKTPIAAMRLLLSGRSDSEAKELSEELLKIEQYVEMVLKFLQLDSGSSDYVLKEYNIDPIIKQSVRKFASQFIRKKITLNYSGVNFRAHTDEKQLGFVIDQVLSNALKYTGAGSVSIYCEEKNVLVIEDTGIGIAPEDVPRVFDSGFTGFNGRTDKKATGIGLFLCKKILCRLGHDISLESAVSKGTKVRIFLETYELNAE